MQLRHCQIFQSFQAVCSGYFVLQRHFIAFLNPTPSYNFLSTDSISVMAAYNGGSWLGCGVFAKEWYFICELADPSGSTWIPQEYTFHSARQWLQLIIPWTHYIECNGLWTYNLYLESLQPPISWRIFPPITFILRMCRLRVQYIIGQWQQNWFFYIFLFLFFHIHLLNEINMSSTWQYFVIWFHFNTV